MHTHTLFSLKKSSSDWIIDITKIVIIISVSIYLVGNFNPYWEFSDSFTYAIQAMYISEGSFTYSNSLLEKFPSKELVPQDWLLSTKGNFVLPAGYVGFFGLLSFVNLIAGPYGLFFLGPISGIVLLLTADRIASIYFGKYVGLLTILFLVTNHLFYRSALNLQTESLFTICVLIASYFLIKFFQFNKEKYLLMASTFFTFSMLIRLNGFVFFPIEIFLVVGFLLIQSFRIKHVSNKVMENNITKQTLISQKQVSKFLKYSISLFLPWIVFFIFWLSYYGYFFDDPLTNHVELLKPDQGYRMTSYLRTDIINYENIERYSKYFLPYQFPRYNDVLDPSENPLDQTFGKNWLGTFSIILLGLFMLISLITKNNRILIATFSTVILGNMLFFALTGKEEHTSLGVNGRYMFTSFTLFYMILGHMLVNLLSKPKIILKRKYLFKIFKIFVIAILVVFFIMASYFAPPIKSVTDKTIELKNPVEIYDSHKIESDILPDDAVLVYNHPAKALEFDLIPYQIFVDKDGTIPPDSIQLLNKIYKENYEIFIIKEPTDIMETQIYNELKKNHNVAFQEFSESFCMLEFLDDEIDQEKISDQLCY